MPVLVPTPREIDGPSNLSQASIDDLIVFVVNAMGAQITGTISASWDMESHVLEANISSGSYASYGEATDIGMTIRMDDAGDLVSVQATAVLTPSRMTIAADIMPADVNSYRKQIIKKAYYAVDALDKIAEATSSDEIAQIMLSALGYEQVVSLTTDWNDEGRELSINFTEAQLGGSHVTDAKLSVSVDQSGSIDSINSAKNEGLSDLDVAEQFIYKIANYAVHDQYNNSEAANQTSLLTGGIGFHLLEKGVDTNQDLIVDGGKILSGDEIISFDHLELATEDVYVTDINISDAIDVLRHIVNLDNLGSDTMNFHAADVNNDDQVNISDAIAILRHIVKLETINSFDLIDGNGRKTQVEPGMSEDVSALTIVANGDVDFSGGFVDNYLMQSELL